MRVVALLDRPDPTTRAEIAAVLAGVGVELCDHTVIPAGPGIVGLIIGPETPLNGAALAQLPDLLVVAASSTGVDHVDLPAAAARGVRVTNVEDYCTLEVADHALALILDLLRGVSRAGRVLREDGWQRATEVGPDRARITGTTLGLVGFGRVAQALAERALALGMVVSAYDPAVEVAELQRLGVRRCAELADLLGGSEVVSLHVPLTEQTRQLINAQTLALMRPGALLVNVARGGLIDSAAVVEALHTGHLAGAGVDVLDPEPPDPDDPLLGLEQVVITPHIAWQSADARRLVFTRAAESIAAVLRGEKADGVPQPSLLIESAEDERRLRVELAAVYRLVAHFRMTDLIFTHISARLPGPDHHFLINPYGLLFEEITASSLVRINLAGEIIGPSPHPVNPAGFVIHSAIHAARPDALCVLHTHTRAGCAVAAQRSGLLPLNQMSLEFYGHIGYHDYEGIALNLDEQKRLVADLGEHPVMILRNHGLLTVGRSPAEAFLRMHYLHRACEIQIDALAGGAELQLPEPEVCERTARQFRGTADDDFRGDPDGDLALAWPALLRLLDRVSPGYEA